MFQLASKSRHRKCSSF